EAGRPDRDGEVQGARRGGLPGDGAAQRPDAGDDADLAVPGLDLVVVGLVQAYAEAAAAGARVEPGGDAAVVVLRAAAEEGRAAAVEGVAGAVQGGAGRVEGETAGALGEGPGALGAGERRDPVRGESRLVEVVAGGRGGNGMPGTARRRVPFGDGSDDGPAVLV